MLTEVDVSVVVPTYNTGSRVPKLLAQIEKQTMPDGRYELVVVDDGSADDTFERLEEAAATRDWMRVERIPNSGWPGRPRNVGTAMARGRYVFYLDHDDELFPESLERLVDTADRYGSDLVVGKEVVQGWSSPGWSMWRRPTGPTPLDRLAFECISPHKLYRRQFLVDHGIAFPEGKVRLEDLHFNGQVWSATTKIALVSDYPCYKWILHDANSHRGPTDWDVYWRGYADSLEAVLRAPEPVRDVLLARWYAGRVLERVGPPLADRTDEYKDQLAELATRFWSVFPPSIDSYLDASERPRSDLLRAGDMDALTLLAREDLDLKTYVDGLAFEWVQGRLEIHVDGGIRHPDGRPLEIRVDEDGRVYRVLPQELEDRLDPSALELTEALREAVVEVVVRARRTSVDWTLPTDATVSVTDVGDTPQVRFRAVATLDLDRSAGGAPLDAGIWDVFLRMDGTGLTPTARVQMVTDPAPAYVAGRSAIPYRTLDGFLALDLGDKARSAIASSRPAPTDAHVLVKARTWRWPRWIRSVRHDQQDVQALACSVRVELPRLTMVGDEEVRGTMRVGGVAVPATLRPGSPASLVTDDFALLAGVYPVQFEFGGRTSPVVFDVCVRDGSVRVVDHP